jgi:hypothetical protein
MTAWPEWIDTGDKYLRSAAGGGGKPPRFAGSLRYNLIAMAFESYAMAACDFNNILPENHTISDLVYSLQQCVTLDAKIVGQLLGYEKFQQICSFTDYTRLEAREEELDGFCDVVGKIAAIAHGICTS